MKTINDIARAFGSQKKMADAVGVSRGAVEQWCQRESIPSKWFFHVVKAACHHGIDLTANRLAEIVAQDDHQDGERGHAA